MMMITASLQHIFNPTTSVKQPGSVTAAAGDFRIVLKDKLSADTHVMNCIRSANQSFARPSTTDFANTRLTEIKAKDTRTAEDMEYLLTYDTKLIEIQDKENKGIGRTSSEIDYNQKARGGINTMAYLSTDEKNMFDSLVASGNQDAVNAIGWIAFLRSMSAVGNAADSIGSSVYDPNNMPITSYTVEKHFRHRFSNDPNNTGEQALQAQFQALIQYLQGQHA